MEKESETIHQDLSSSTSFVSNLLVKRQNNGKLMKSEPRLTSLVSHLLGTIVTSQHNGKLITSEQPRSTGSRSLWHTRKWTTKYYEIKAERIAAAFAEFIHFLIGTRKLMRKLLQDKDDIWMANDAQRERVLDYFPGSGLHLIEGDDRRTSRAE